MCRLHAVKVACAYSQLGYADRQLVDAAWSLARISDPLLGWAVRTVRTIRDSQIRIFACSAASDSNLLDAEQKVVRDSAAESFTRICDIAVVRASQDYWPSREFIRSLASRADPNVDFLIVDHKSGKVERWSLQQISDCDRTTESSHPIITTAYDQTAFEAAADIGSNSNG
jgi:hypothetical protein